MFLISTGKLSAKEGIQICVGRSGNRRITPGTGRRFAPAAYSFGLDFSSLVEHHFLVVPRSAQQTLTLTNLIK
jgi:hypothetical protein